VKILLPPMEGNRQEIQKREVGFFGGETKFPLFLTGGTGGAQGFKAAAIPLTNELAREVFEERKGHLEGERKARFGLGGKGKGQCFQPTRSETNSFSKPKKAIKANRFGQKN